MKRIVYFIALFIPGFVVIHSQTVNLTQIVGVGITEPIGVYFAPGDNNTMYILEQGGIIKVANASTGVVSGTNFLNVTSKVTSSGNEQGLLGMAFHPDYANNGYFFINYTRTAGGATVVSRYKRSTGNPLVADAASEDIVITIPQPFSNHNGGQIQFGRDGYLYIGMGDGGSANDPQGHGQNRLSLLAKMLRLDIDVDSGYSIPPSNPFINSGNTLPEIWSLGLRNPWRFSFDQVTADMWIADVGQNVWEEIDFEASNSTGGKNYGWRCYEGNTAFNTVGCQPQSTYEAPVFVYNHSGGNCSVTGGFVYRGGSFADFYGKYVFADYCSGKFWFTAPDNLGGWTTNQVTTTPSLTYQISSFGQDNDGEIYVVSRDNNRIYKMTGNACAPADIYTSTGSFVSCEGSLQLFAPYSANNSYKWFLDNNLLTGQNSNTLNATQAGIYRVEVENTNTNCGDTASIEVIVSSPTPATVSLPNVTYCSNEGNIAIATSPAGGTLLGVGVSGNTFNPSGLSGSQNIYYTYQNTDGCISRDTFSVAITEAPVVDFTIVLPVTDICMNDFIPLTATPAGGAFAGPGVQGNQINTTTAGVGGPYVYTYTYTTGVCAVTDTGASSLFISNCYSSIDENEYNSIAIYPNPFTDLVTISLDGDKNITVFSSDGKKVYQQNILTQVVSLSSLAEGTYILQIEYQGKIYKRVLVKTKP